MSALHRLCAAFAVLAHRRDMARDDAAMRVITLDGRRLATAGAGLARLEDDLHARPSHDPLRRFASAMCLYCLAIEEGAIDAAYDEQGATAFARALLIPDDVLLAGWEQHDERLAAQLAVPVAQIALRRLELTTSD